MTTFKMDLMVAKWRVKKQVLCQSKTQPCMKKAQLRRTLQKLVKIPNASQGSFSCKIKGFKAESESIDSSLQAVKIRVRVKYESSFPWLFGTGTFSQVAGVLNTKLFKFKMAPRDFILWPCFTWRTAYRWILPHSLMKKLGIELIGEGLLVEHSQTAGGFAEATGTELCKGNVK